MKTDFTIKEKTQWAIDHFKGKCPAVLGSNKHFYGAFLNLVCKSRAIPDLTEAQIQAVLDYCPETVCRYRRELLEGTSEQYARAENKRREYSKKPYNQPLIEK